MFFNQAHELLVGITHISVNSYKLFALNPIVTSVSADATIFFKCFFDVMDYLLGRTYQVLFQTFPSAILLIGIKLSIGERLLQSLDF
jgi:hypothetical protein